MVNVRTAAPKLTGFGTSRPSDGGFKGFRVLGSEVQGLGYKGSGFRGLEETGVSVSALRQASKVVSLIGK